MDFVQYSVAPPLFFFLSLPFIQMPLLGQQLLAQTVCQLMCVMCLSKLSRARATQRYDFRQVSGVETFQLSAEALMFN